MKMLHPIFHWALIGADFIYPSGEECCTTGIHTLCNFVILDAGFHVRSTLGIDEFTILIQHSFRGIPWDINGASSLKLGGSLLVLLQWPGNQTPEETDHKGQRQQPAFANSQRATLASNNS